MDITRCKSKILCQLTWWGKSQSLKTLQSFIPGGTNVFEACKELRNEGLVDINFLGTPRFDKSNKVVMIELKG